MSSILNNNWYNLNSTRKYPLDDGCTGIDDSGKLFPATLVSDLHLRMTKSVGVGAMISSIVVSDTLVSLTFLAINHPILPSIYDPAPPALAFSPLCSVSLRKPVEPGVVYQIQPMTKGVAGWIVFGDGIAKAFNGRFSSPVQSALAPKICRYYNDFPVTSIGKLRSTYSLQGLVSLVEGADISITNETRVIEGEARKSIVFALKESTGSNVFQSYGGPCAGRPESNTCAREGIQFINTVSPDCNGNIDLVFDRPFRVSGITNDPNSGLSSSSSSAGYIDGQGGLIIDYPIGLNEACTRGDRLPDANGNLPGQYTDQCAEDTTDPDANAYPSDNPFGPPPVLVSSSTIDCMDLPVYTNFDKASSRFWQTVKGSFEFSTTDSPYEPVTDYSSSSLVYYSSSLSSSSSYAPFDPVDRSYAASGLIGRNISLWYNCGYSSIINTRVQVDVLLSSSDQYYPNGGLVINYRPNSDGTLDEYFLVELTKYDASLRISRFNGFAPVQMASVKPIAIGENIWYRLVAEVTPSATPGRTRITGKVYDASTMALLGTAVAESSLYLPDSGKVGLTSEKAVANFSYFRMENL